jgi:hypothetical protein
MAEPPCLNDETSEDGSTSYSEFCDDDTIRGATTPQSYATQSHARDSSPLPSTNTSCSQPSQVLGKRKAPDGAEGSVAGPSALYSYKKRFLSDSIDSILGCSEAATLDSDDTLFATQSSDDTPPPCIIVGSVNIGPRRYHY